MGGTPEFAVVKMRPSFKVREQYFAQLRTYLMRDKEFLQSIFKSKSLLETCQILRNSDYTKLNTLIKYLHFYSTGEVYLEAQTYNQILNEYSAVDNYLRRTLRDKKKTIILLKCPKATKLKFLFKLRKIYPYILYPVFDDHVFCC